MSRHTLLWRNFMKKFCDITTRNELADFLEIPRSKLTHILYVQKPDNYYTSFDIPKKQGGVRQINAPTGDLKEIQRELADALWNYQKNIWENRGITPCISHAFEKKKSIITNAQIHRNKRIIINMDLENFFDSFHFGRVQGFFEKNREFALPYKVSVVIAQLACYEGRLPQGAPSSPIITNLICKILDNRLLKIAKKYRTDYTRYADDLTFSTNNKAFLELQSEFFSDIIKEIQNAGFNINDKKTRIAFRNSRQEVTGLIVNKKLNVDRRYFKKTKSMAYHLYTEGSFMIDNVEGTIKQLEGRFAFINQLDWYNNKYDKKTNHCFRELNSREREYRKFLFYEYFFRNDKPLIITEGKTDIAYLRAALKNLYVEYPNLIKKKENGEFEFKISFLKRSKRLRYFFNVSVDGADAISTLYKYFDTQNREKGYDNLFEYFIRICKEKPSNPIILIFDNELDTSQKPISKFLNSAHSSKEQQNVLKEKRSIKLLDNVNLFLLIHPLIDGKKECEIENLFEEETLQHKINGKEFSLKDGYDKTKYYGKEIFSKYIENNYKKINFNKFRKVFNDLNQIIESYKNQ